MSLNPTELKRLKDAFNQWAKNHPTPDQRDIRTPDGSYSPKEIAREIQNETAIGKGLIGIFDACISSGIATLDQIVADFTKPSPPPKPGK